MDENLTPVIRVHGDFNGLFGDLLCLSHGEPCTDEFGGKVHLGAGMMVTAFCEETNEQGVRDDLVATGVVEPSPDWLGCKGSKWVLKIDQNGVNNESQLGV